LNALQTASFSTPWDGSRKGRERGLFRIEHARRKAPHIAPIGGAPALDATVLVAKLNEL
jgi:hypothetical protein